MKETESYNELLPHMFRQEYAKMTAILCRHFGLKHIEIAEDIASDTFLKASEHWAINGIPENPTAWLYTVAKNKTKDYIKHLSVFESKVKSDLDSNKSVQSDFEYNEQIIKDSQLAMIFAVCNPANNYESQIALALQILSGFSVEEIANAFLTKRETIKKRLHRARLNLRNNNFQIRELTKEEIESRQSTVLSSIYLLFNEGYFSKTNNQLIRKELCFEAIRLTKVLSDNKLTNTSQTNALMALMCFQSSRLEARTDQKGEAILFDDQDRKLWNKLLIEKGNFYLRNATIGKEISKYHLEAGIAYWHTTANKNKWRSILQLYNQLITMEYSPITALNRTFAFSKVYGPEKAILEAEKLKLNENNQYHELLGYLYTQSNIPKAIEHYEKSMELTKSEIEIKSLKKEIERLKEKTTSNNVYKK